MANTRIDDLEGWFDSLLGPSALIELAVWAGCVVLALGLTWLVRRLIKPKGASILLGLRLVDGVLFPLLLLWLVYVARLVVMQRMPVPVFQIAVPVCLSLAAIRLGVKVLQAAFPAAPLVRALERTFSWIAWLAVLLWISGFLPLLLDELDQIKWKVGGASLSVRTLLEGVLSAGAVLIVTLWISSVIEARLLRSATGGELSLRKAASGVTRALLMFIGLLLALSAVGIDLTALSVLGGAIGVGIGFGLQKLAANYVSGFVILAERNLRIGDTVKVDGFEGCITDIRTRSTVIRAQNGHESIVPNDMLLTSRVENMSLADTRVAQSTVVTVGHDSDVELVMRLLRAAAAAQPPVLMEPAPLAALSAFAADGLEFTLAYWVADPQYSQLKLRSAVNLAILKALRENQIDIPFPQRVVHSVGTAAAPTLTS